MATTRRPPGGKRIPIWAQVFTYGLLVIFILSSVGGIVNINPPEAPSSSEGLQTIQEGFEREITYWQGRVRSEPRNAQAAANLAQAYHQAGHLDSAIVFYKKAIALDPTMLSATLQLAQVYLDQGQRALQAKNTSAAAAHYRQALKVLNEAPSHLKGKPAAGDLARLHMLRMDAYYLLGRKPQALAAVRQAIAADPANLDYYDAQAALQQQLQQFVGAAATLQHAAALARKQHREPLAAAFAAKAGFQAHLAKADAYVRSGRMQQGVAEVQKAVKGSPDNLDGYDILANLQAQIGQKQAAATTLKQGAAAARRQHNDQRAALFEKAALSLGQAPSTASPTPSRAWGEPPAPSLAPFGSQSTVTPGAKGGAAPAGPLPLQRLRITPQRVPGSPVKETPSPSTGNIPNGSSVPETAPTASPTPAPSRS